MNKQDKKFEDLLTNQNKMLVDFREESKLINQRPENSERKHQ